MSHPSVKCRFTLASLRRRQRQQLILADMLLKENSPRFDSHLGTLFSYNSSAFVFVCVTHALVKSLILSGQNWAANIASWISCWLLFVSSELMCGRKNPAAFTVHSGSHLFLLSVACSFNCSHAQKKKKSPLTLLPSNMMTTSLCAYSWISVNHAWSNRNRQTVKSTDGPTKQGEGVSTFG